MGTQTPAQLETSMREDALRYHGGMTEDVFLDRMLDSDVATHPGFRVRLVNIERPQDRRAFLETATSILQDMGRERAGNTGALAKKRAWAKLLLLGRVLVRRPLGKARMTKLNINNWNTVQRLRHFGEGRFLAELWSDSLALAPLERRPGAPRAPPSTEPEVAAPALMQMGVVNHESEDTVLDQRICARRAKGQPPARWKALADPLSREGQAIHQRVAQNLIGKAAAMLTTEVSGVVDEQGLLCLQRLHPAARNLRHRGADQQLPRLEGLPRLNITVEHVIQAAQSAPRASCGGPDSVDLDLLTHPLLKADAEKYRKAGPAEKASDPTFAYLDALRTVIERFVEGDIPADVATAMFSATGFAAAKPDGGIRPLACGTALRRLAFRTIVRASTDSLQSALGASQFGVSYPGGAEACKLGLETTLIRSQQAFLWIDSTNAFNTICRQLIKEAVTLFVPEWLNLYAACYEIKTKFIIRSETNTAVDIKSEEGVHQGCPLGPALFCLGLRLVHLLVRHARGTEVDLKAEGVSAYALRLGTWEAVLARFNADPALQRHIQDLLARRQDFLDLNQDTGPFARSEPPALDVDPQDSLRAYMDDQYAIGPPGSLAFECALIGIISEHHAGLVPNINKNKLKTGMFIPHEYSRVEELRTLFPGVIISLDTPPHMRGVKVLGSILRNSHPDYVETSLKLMLQEAIDTHALPLLHLHSLQDRYHIMHKSFMQRFTHLFRTLPPSLTQDFAAALGDSFVRLFDYCTGGRHTKLLHDPSIGEAEVAHFLRLFLPYKSGGMGLTDPHMLRHTAYLGCWTSLLTLEGAERWKRSFPALANICSDPILGPSAPTPTDGSDDHHSLPAELQTCVSFVVNPTCRRDLPCPLGPPPVAGDQAHAAQGRAPHAGNNNNDGHNPPDTSMVSKLIAARRTESPISFKDLESVDGPRGTKAGQHALSAHSQRHTSSLIRKSLLDRTSNNPQAADAKVVLPLVRTHASIIAGSAPNAAMTFTGIPSDSRSTLTNEEWRINSQLRLGLPLASYHNLPHEACPHGCTHPQTKEPVKVRYGYHLVTDCRRANQGKKSHKDVETTLMHHFNTYTSITATKAKPFSSRHPPLGHHHHRQPGGPELVPRRHVHQPHGGHQPGVHQPCCPQPPAGPGRS